MPFFRLRKKAKAEPRLDSQTLRTSIEEELRQYVSRDELQDAIKKIQKDERRRKIWEGLSTRKKIELLRYVFGKKGEGHVKE